MELNSRVCLFPVNYVLQHIKICSDSMDFYDG